jgi:DNA invertase Pin-like site-specific DNA recombinase
MRLGYVRVSTVEQNEARQIAALETHGIEKWYIEKASAKDTNRPQLQAMLDYAREGDTIYVHDFSRLARSLSDLRDIVNNLDAHGILLVSNKENIDTGTPSGKLMLAMIGAINEFERDTILERQREGIALAKLQGKYKGRKKIGFPENWKAVYSRYKTRGMTGRSAMAELGLKPTTFYKLVKEYETQKE